MSSLYDDFSRSSGGLGGTSGSSMGSDDLVAALMDSPEIVGQPRIPVPQKPLHQMNQGELDVYLDGKSKHELKQMFIQNLQKAMFEEQRATQAERRAWQAEAEFARLRDEMARIVKNNVGRQNIPPDSHPLDMLEILEDIVRNRRRKYASGNYDELRVVLEEEILGRIVEKIRTLTPKEDEIQQSAYYWMQELRSYIDSHKSEVEELTAKVRAVNIQKEKLGNRLQVVTEEIEKMRDSLNYQIQKRNVIQRTMQNLDFGERTPPRSLSSTVYYDAMSTPGSIMQSPQSAPDVFTPPRQRKRKTMLSNEPTVSLSSFDFSREQFVLGSPYPEVTRFDDTNSMSLHTTPRSATSPYSVSLPSPFDIPTSSMRSYDESGTRTGIVGTIAMPGPSSKFAPGTATVSSPIQSHVTNRFDIGKSFKLRTVCQTSTPYHQVTRVASSIPESGYSGEMINYPLNITHSAEITPRQYETPFVSRSRFGYTDPTAIMLNIPPDLVIRAPVQEQGVSPDVETYGTPPAITPTTTRRHGLFTPKGIFRKRHYNIRRLFDPEDYLSPPLSDSPLYSDRVQLTKRPCSPCERPIMDRTFGVSPVMDRTFDAPTTHAMDRTFDATAPHALNRTFGSTIPKTTYGLYDEILPQSINRTFDASSPESLYETQGASPLYTINRTFDLSPQDNISGIFDAQPEYNLNRTYDATSPVALNRTFEASNSPARNRTFDASPHVLNRTFQTSPRAQSVNRTFDETLESLFHVPYRRPIHTRGTRNLNRTFSPNRTFDMTPSSVLDEA